MTGRRPVSRTRVYELSGKLSLQCLWIHLEQLHQIEYAQFVLSIWYDQLAPPRRHIRQVVEKG